MKKRVIVIAVLLAVLLSSLIVYSQWIRPLVEFDEGEGTVMVETQEGEVLGTQLRYQIFPKIDRENLASIKVKNKVKDESGEFVKNESGEYKFNEFEFYKDGSGELVLRGCEGTAINGQQLSELVVSAGYPLALLKVATDDAGYEEYGLNDPVCTWTITALDGTSHTLRVGHKVHTDEGYYVCMDGRNAVYVLSKSIEEPLLSSPTVFVTPVVMAVASNNDYYTIDKLSISHRGEDGLEPFVMFCHTDESNMRHPDAISEMSMLYPAEYLSNETEVWNVCMLMTSLTGDSTAAINADEETYAEFGLDDPAYMISFEYQNIPFWVTISDKSEDGGYYATSNLNPSVISHVAGETFEFLEHDLFKWINDKVFDYDIQQVQDLTVKRGDGKVSFDMKYVDDGTENGALNVVCSAGKPFTSEDQIWNYKLFYRTLIGVEMIDYAPLTEAERRELTSDPENSLFWFEYTTMANKTTRIEFWPYSTRRCLVTINGEGEFYVLIDRVEKLISDVERVLNDEEIDSFGKD